MNIKLKKRLIGLIWGVVSFPFIFLFLIITVNLMQDETGTRGRNCVPSCSMDMSSLNCPEDNTSDN
ncbi:MAG: hypothetical protein LBK58_02525 [Prevotellaceae bacterium]|nr:hypothetical protein [Prevotellaceae bacterium]